MTVLSDAASRTAEQAPAAPTPVLQQVPLELLCTLGWIQATIHMPAHQSVDDCLALSGPSLRLTRVRIPGEPELHSFAALRVDSVALVVPLLGGAVVSGLAYGPMKRREIACLLADRVLRGVVDIPANLRLSDFLRLDQQFLAVRHGFLAPYGATLHSPEAKRLELALVNRDRVIGVSEPVG